MKFYIIGIEERSKTVDKREKRYNKSVDISKSKEKTNINNLSKQKKKKKKLIKMSEKEKLNKKKERFISLYNDDKKDDLYSLLGVSKTATNEEIRNAYRNLVFLYHPDKNKTDSDASYKFINISRAYKVLSNKQSRILYDETGEYEEDGKEQTTEHISINDFRKKVSVKDTENYKNKYKNSKEEEEDLINFYKQEKGNITNILEAIPYSTNKDIKRYLKIFENLFKGGYLKRNDTYEKTKNNIKLINSDIQEEIEAKEILEKLTKQITERNHKRNFNDYLLELARKYEDDKIDEINDELKDSDFQNIIKGFKKQEKLKKKKK